MRYMRVLAGAFALSLAGGMASAATVSYQYFEGNECGKGGFSDCEAWNGVKYTPTILKFDDEFEVDDINTTFTTIDGSEFTFTANAGKSMGTWTYTPGVGDPLITAWAVKAGNGYNLYSGNGASFSSGDWLTPQGKELSHITFFDTGAPGGEEPPAVPLPASALLLLAGIGGMGALRRRKKA